MDERSMIRLVNQFDEPTTRVTVSTPTCGCCCCCCCCLATVASSSVITYLNLRSIGRKEKVLEKEKTQVFAVAGIFALPALLFIIYMFSSTDVVASFTLTVIMLITIWTGILAYLYKKVGGGKKTAIYVGVTVVITTIAFVGELFLGIRMISKSLGWEYLLIAGVATVFIVRAFTSIHRFHQ